MAITALPLSDSFGLVWSGDPSLDHDRPDFDTEYERCTERLDYTPLLKEGAKPTLWVFRPVPMRELLDAGHGNLELAALLFRMSLTRVENFEGLPPLNKKRSQDYPKLGGLVDAKVIDFLDQLAAELGFTYGHIVSSLGWAVFNRLKGADPKA